MKNKAFIDNCIKAMHEGITMGTDGLFYSYIGNGIYIESDPIDREWDVQMNEEEMRRKLQRYYEANPMSMDMDREYIEELLGSAV